MTIPGLSAAKLISGLSPIRDLDARMLISRMTPRPNSLRAKLIQQVILDLKATGAWQQMDALWVFAAHSQVAMLLNWKANAYNCVVKGNTSPGFFVLNKGFQGRGPQDGGSISTYPDPGMYVGAAYPFLFSQARAHLAAWVNFERAGQIYSFGGEALSTQRSDGSGAVLDPFNYTSEANRVRSYVEINGKSGQVGITEPLIKDRFFLGTLGQPVQGSSTYYVNTYYDDAGAQSEYSRDEGTSIRPFPNSRRLFINASDAGKGVNDPETPEPSRYSTQLIRMASIGGYLTPVQARSVRSAFRKYFVAIGAIPA